MRDDRLALMRAVVDLLDEADILRAEVLRLKPDAALGRAVRAMGLYMHIYLAYDDPDGWDVDAEFAPLVRGHGSTPEAALTAAGLMAVAELIEEESCLTVMSTRKDSKGD